MMVITNAFLTPYHLNLDVGLHRKICSAVNNFTNIIANSSKFCDINYNLSPLIRGVLYYGKQAKFALLIFYQRMFSLFFWSPST